MAVPTFVLFYLQAFLLVSYVSILINLLRTVEITSELLEGRMPLFSLPIIVLLI